MNRSELRAIPSVDKILHAMGDLGLPHAVIVDVVRREFIALRRAKTVPDFDQLLSRFQTIFCELRASRIQPVINGTGILIHTNFGRAPLGATVVDTLTKIGWNYNNLEYGLTGGARGGRAVYLEKCLALLCGAESATVVNNNAAALILILRHFCDAKPAGTGRRSGSGKLREESPKNEVIISRGELIQIGGGFRIPEILESSGARLHEVGTTNKTTLNDYAQAIHRQTALILKVHRSNFYMGGFVESPRTEDIAAVARKKRIPFVEDLGSGAAIETETISGLEHETTPAELIRGGVDLICFSGDKLFGGPQAGIIAGKAQHIAALKREPLFRALRCDKLILAALETTAEIHLRAAQYESSRVMPGRRKTLTTSSASAFVSVPVVEMLRVSIDELQSRANHMASALQGLPLTAAVGKGDAQVGGGTLPRSVIPSVTLDLSHPILKPQEMAARLREHSTPIIGYVARGKLKLDLRTIFPSQDIEVIQAIRALPGESNSRP